MKNYENGVTLCHVPITADVDGFFGDSQAWLLLEFEFGFFLDEDEELFFVHCAPAGATGATGAWAGLRLFV